MDTKACNLTENEITQLIIWHGYNLNDEGKASADLDIAGDMADRIERINYLNKRLKTFKEPEVKPVETTSTATAPATQGWGSTNNG